MASEAAVFEIPRLRAVARHALPNVLEASIIPVAVFVVALHLAGITGALVGAIAWAYGAIAVRLMTGRRVSGLLLLGAATLTARTMIAVATGSVFVYFLQPTLGTVMVGFAFALSVPLGHPLALRLSQDFCPIPTETMSDPRVRRFFMQISLLWAVVQLSNAGLAIWLLVSQSVGTFVVARTATSATLTLTAIGASVLWFRHTMARHGIAVVRWRDTAVESRTA